MSNMSEDFNENYLTPQEQKDIKDYKHAKREYGSAAVENIFWTAVAIGVFGPWGALVGVTVLTRGKEAYDAHAEIRDIKEDAKTRAQISAQKNPTQPTLTGTPKDGLLRIRQKPEGNKPK